VTWWKEGDVVANKGDTCSCCGNGSPHDPKACGACNGDECNVCDGTGRHTETIIFHVR
jgi:hypothetical protein